MARKLIVEIIGDSRSLEAAFAKSGVAAKGFGDPRFSGTLSGLS